MVRMLSRDRVFVGKRLVVEKILYELESGVFEKEVVVFPETVVVLPVLDDERIVLIKQYRPSIDTFIYEAPAGIVELGESAREAAIRELVEETGYRPSELIEIGSFYTTPGYSTERLHFFIARKLEYVGTAPEKYEVIEPVTMELNNAVELIKNNVINDLKTAMVILFYLSMHNTGRSK